MTQESRLQRLVEKLRRRPEAAAHILELRECGSDDHVDASPAVDKLPVSTTSGKKIMQEILVQLMRSLKTVLELFSQDPEVRFHDEAVLGS